MLLLIWFTGGGSCFGVSGQGALTEAGETGTTRIPSLIMNSSGNTATSAEGWVYEKCWFTSEKNVVTNLIF